MNFRYLLVLLGSASAGIAFLSSTPAAAQVKCDLESIAKMRELGFTTDQVVELCKDGGPAAAASGSAPPATGQAAGADVSGSPWNGAWEYEEGACFYAAGCMPPIPSGQRMRITIENGSPRIEYGYCESTYSCDESKIKYETLEIAKLHTLSETDLHVATHGGPGSSGGVTIFELQGLSAGEYGQYMVEGSKSFLLGGVPELASRIRLTKIAKPD